jgi:hypothetical protein
MTTKKKLCNIKGISEAKMEKIKEAAAKLCVSHLFVLLFIKVDCFLVSKKFLYIVVVPI